MKIIEKKITTICNECDYESYVFGLKNIGSRMESILCIIDIYSDAGPSTYNSIILSKIMDDNFVTTIEEHKTHSVIQEMTVELLDDSAKCIGSFVSNIPNLDKLQSHKVGALLQRILLVKFGYIYNIHYTTDSFGLRILSQYPNRLYSAMDVAEILGKTRNTIHTWIRKGIIKSVSVCGTQRIHESEIQRILNDRADDSD